MNTKVELLAAKCKAATKQIAIASLEQRNSVLQALIKNLIEGKENILSANRQDIKQAQLNGLNPAMLERLSLENRLEGIIHDIENIIALPDPLGELFDKQELENGLSLSKLRTAIGVLGVIYESRPNVTIDITALAIKTGNCALLRGGSEALHTNQALIEMIQQSLKSTNLPADAIQLIASSDRSQVKELLQLNEYIDLIIPRGGASLQQFCRENSTIPVITGGIGICHLFVDETANLELSLEVIFNAKTQRPTVCNSLDTLLVHTAIAAEFIPRIIKKLREKDVTFRLDKRSIQFTDLSCRLAQSKDWDTEWLDLILGIKIVDNLQEAIEHIDLHSSQHSDGILTENPHNAERFIKEVDSAAVYVNASTRFTDGAQFRLGGEVAVSTQKLHARGPMGLKALTTYKWIIRGKYQVRK